ncbi:CaiB/BaiF CoA transferase family protein [Pusillimonas noertemannii]|uniref:CaiB/BaiF CoA transferase family protein n=1 Tax=Pusillimonas noertemannii TaxID=305977 RepID=UPI0033411ADC
MRPLDGITIISLEHAVAVPFATRQLADLGARVIKIERPEQGDFARAYDTRVKGLSSYFVWANRSKESLTLNLKHPEAMRVLMNMIGKADVFIQNLAPGAASRLGLSNDALRPTHPGLIICDVSGYGSDGPYHDKKAYDIMVQAEAGLMSVTGSQDAPSRAGFSAADVSAGMYAYSNVLSALILRMRTGKGSHIDVAMLESLTEWMSNPLYYAYDDAPPAPRSAASHPSIYPYGPFSTGDGKTVLLGIQNEREWTTFCEVVLQQPALARDPDFDSNVKRSERREELLALIESVFAPLGVDEVQARLDKASIGNARMRTMHDVWDHPQLKARNRWRKVGTPAGPIDALLPPGINDSYEYCMGDVPALGEHTEPILSELGYDSNDIQRLRSEGAI